MAFLFKPKDPLPDEVLRLIGEQIDRMEGHLRSSGLASRRVHDVRKRIKETRAILRLVRPHLGQHFEAENTWYRDAARDLAGARDAAALAEAVEKLRRLSQGRIERRRMAAVRNKLKAMNHADTEVEGRIANVLAQLPVARARLAFWPALQDHFSTVGDGLERIFRDGRRAFRRAANDGSPELLHELRKRVKDHWYHSQLFRRIWPAMMEPYAGVIKELSDALGDHHDLVVLRQTLTDNPQAYGDEATLRTMFTALEARLVELEKHAITIAAHLYSENPRAWRERVQGYWRLAAGTRHDIVREPYRAFDEHEV